MTLTIDDAQDKWQMTAYENLPEYVRDFYEEAFVIARLSGEDYPHGVAVVKTRNHFSFASYSYKNWLSEIETRKELWDGRVLCKK